MKRVLFLAAISLVALAGCQKREEAAVETAGGRGRFVGVGHYSVGRMWQEVVRPAAKTPAAAGAALPKDDEEIIVVLDSTTGEIRQCGNLSGQCIGMSPWARPLAEGESGPVTLSRHADQLDLSISVGPVNKKTEAEPVK